jgi:glycosyltransferase involved in cell wall biosynthesis
VLLEAAACGVPVVTCDAPGCREAVEDRVTGYLIPPKNSQALTDAIDALVSDDHLRRRMGQAGRLRAERLFDERAIVARHIDVYRRIGLPVDDNDTHTSRQLHAA